MIFYFLSSTHDYVLKQRKTCFLPLVLPYAIASINPKLIRFTQIHITKTATATTKNVTIPCKTKCIFYSKILNATTSKSITVEVVLIR